MHKLCPPHLAPVPKNLYTIEIGGGSMLYEALFRGLHKVQIRYLVVGAVAVNLHGVPRMTADLDLMLDMAEPNLRRFVEATAALGYRPRVPVAADAILDSAKRREWQESKSMVMFTWIHPTRPYEEIDIFLENPIDFESAYVNRTDVPIQDFTIPIAGIHDLIALKRIAGRDQDRSDIDALTKLLRSDEEG